jgi:ADP-heptose:LPS heptosyltransferase
VKRILVIKLSALGDFFIASSAFEKIRQHHSEDYITLLTTAPYLNIARRLGYFDDILLDERPRLTQPLKIWNLRNRLVRSCFDRVYDLQMVDRTSFYHQLARTSFKKRLEWVGTARGASHPYQLPQLPTYHQTRLEGLLVAGGIAPPLPPLNITRLSGQIQNFDLPHPYVLFVPGASAAHRARKCWPLNRYAKVARHVALSGFTPVIIGGTDENNNELGELCPQAIDLTGKTGIDDVITLSTYAAFAIGGDTGPMHIAAACLCPVLVLFFGDTDPKAGGPRGSFYRHIHKKNKDDLDPEAVINLLPEFIERHNKITGH